jgi:hypothetical protein
VTRLLVWLAESLSRYLGRPEPRELDNEIATLLALEQDGRGDKIDLNWIRGARLALIWARGERGAVRPAEALRRARFARSTGAQ